MPIRTENAASPSHRIDQVAGKQCCNGDTQIAENLVR